MVRTIDKMLASVDITKEARTYLSNVYKSLWFTFSKLYEKDDGHGEEHFKDIVRRIPIVLKNTELEASRKFELNFIRDTLDTFMLATFIHDMYSDTDRELHHIRAGEFVENLKHMSQELTFIRDSFVEVNNVNSADVAINKKLVIVDDSNLESKMPKLTDEEKELYPIVNILYERCVDNKTTNVLHNYKEFVLNYLFIKFRIIDNRFFQNNKEVELNHIYNWVEYFFLDKIGLGILDLDRTNMFTNLKNMVVNHRSSGSNIFVNNYDEFFNAIDNDRPDIYKIMIRLIKVNQFKKHMTSEDEFCYNKVASVNGKFYNLDNTIRTLLADPNVDKSLIKPYVHLWDKFSRDGYMFAKPNPTYLRLYKDEIENLWITIDKCIEDFEYFKNLWFNIKLNIELTNADLAILKIPSEKDIKEAADKWRNYLIQSCKDRLEKEEYHKGVNKTIKNKYTVAYLINDESILPILEEYMILYPTCYKLQHFVNYIRAIRNIVWGVSDVFFRNGNRKFVSLPGVVRSTTLIEYKNKLLKD